MTVSSDKTGKGTSRPPFGSWRVLFLGTSWMSIRERSFKYLDAQQITNIYIFQIWISPWRGRLRKKVTLRYFSGNDLICHSRKFQPSETPLHVFLPISPRYFNNRCYYFSLNIWVVYDHLEVDWLAFDWNWAKTRLLHFQLFQFPNATNRRIVQCVHPGFVILIYSACVFAILTSCDLGSS